MVRAALPVCRESKLKTLNEAKSGNVRDPSSAVGLSEELCKLIMERFGQPMQRKKIKSFDELMYELRKKMGYDDRPGSAGSDRTSSSGGSSALTSTTLEEVANSESMLLVGRVLCKKSMCRSSGCMPAVP